MKYTIYNPVTGEILQTITSANADVIALNLAGQHYVEGEYSGRDFYVENGQVTSIPARPDGKYRFNFASKSWQLDIEAAKTQIRVQRNQLLYAVDRVNPVWYSTLSDQQRTELAQYRQALLDVPQQTGFPESVVWPTQPTWF